MSNIKIGVLALQGIALDIHMQLYCQKQVTEDSYKLEKMFAI